MKLTSQQVDTIHEQTGFNPLPDEIAQESGLTTHFGENTFYVDKAGVYVFEDLEGEDEAAEGQSVTAVMIAALEPTGQEDEVQVRAVQPQATTTTVAIG